MAAVVCVRLAQYVKMAPLAVLGKRVLIYFVRKW